LFAGNISLHIKSSKEHTHRHTHTHTHTHTQFLELVNKNRKVIGYKINIQKQLYANDTVGKNNKVISFTRESERIRLLEISLTK
jgi:hypothetical protein